MVFHKYFIIFVPDMSIGHHAGNTGRATVVSPETMYDTVMELGIVPFFENVVPGFSIEERTPPQFWFDGDGAALGPWDWKIECVQSGDIAYGKFLLGGKAAFATVEWYRELMNWRRSLPSCRPSADGEKILEYLEREGSIGIREVRGLLGVKKSAADAAITRLQRQCRVVTGDITRVYRGEDLSYKGWQTSSFCTPEALFGEEAPAGFPFGPSPSLKLDHSPEESYRRLLAHLRQIAPGISEKQLQKLLA